jgi:hypothetical protein
VGSTLSSDCTCNDGYTGPDGGPCRLAFFITVSVTMPYTKAEFDDAKQVAYKSAVADAAGTPPSNVDIASVTESRRRAGGVEVETKVSASRVFIMIVE